PQSRTRYATRFD
ncbi:lipopolysaccharide biosynthesis protein, partial [Helicobacter pylori]